MKPSNITSEQFTQWRISLGMSQSAAAARLGISVSSICIYEAGKRKEGSVNIPYLVALGMAAISANLNPYGEL